MAVTVVQGDCIEVMRKWKAESVDAIVCDPPYGLEFMGKEWDSFSKKTPNAKGNKQTDKWGPAQIGVPLPRYRGKQKQSLLPFQQWCEEWGREALRILKPGGYILAFGGSRTYHRLAAGLEDAGFEIRDSIVWMYGSGMPKYLNAQKAVRKHGEATQEDIDRAKGWGTALKPAHEPIIVARKETVGTVASNILTYGTGALNIEACRIRTDENLNGGAYSGGTRPNSAMGQEGEAGGKNSMLERGGGRLQPDQYQKPSGRWPPNVIF